MSDIRRSFSTAAGESVTFLRSKLTGRTLEVVYVIDGHPKDERTATIELMNGAGSEIASKAAFLGTQAGRVAFQGKRDAQIKQLSEGKLAK